MNLIKYFLSLFSLLLGFVVLSLKELYQNLVLAAFCSALYKFGPNAGCDLLMSMPDFGFLFLIIGIFGILISAYLDLARDYG